MYLLSPPHPPSRAQGVGGQGCLHYKCVYVCVCFLKQVSDHHVYNVTRSVGFSLELRPGLRVIPADGLLEWGPLKSSIYIYTYIYVYMYIGILTIVPRD